MFWCRIAPVNGEMCNKYKENICILSTKVGNEPKHIMIPYLSILIIRINPPDGFNLPKNSIFVLILFLKLYFNRFKSGCTCIRYIVCSRTSRATYKVNYNSFHFVLSLLFVMYSQYLVINVLCYAPKQTIVIVIEFQMLSVVELQFHTGVNRAPVTSPLGGATGTTFLTGKKTYQCGRGLIIL